MEEEEDSDDREIQKKLTLNQDEEKIHTKLTEHFSRYKNITKDMVLKILIKTPKSRTDVENRMIADYLSKNYDYFKKIKETSQKRFLKLISVISFETFNPNELIININYDEDKFFVVFDGTVLIYRQSFYEKEMKLETFCNYLFYIKQKDEQQYIRLLNQNKHFGINFEEITENPYYNKFKIKKFIFTIEDLEEIGKFSNGYVFGEMNLMRKKKKDTLVKTVTKTQVISVNKFDFNRILRTIEEKRLELLSDKFKKRFNMFKFWSMEQLITLFNYCSYEVFHKDDYIYKQNEPSQYIYFIEKGKFEQYCNTSFSWYKNYLEYIGNFNDNLINLILAKKPENIKKLRQIYEEELENQEKKDNLISSNKIESLSFLNKKDIYLDKLKTLEKYEKTNNLFHIKKEEDELNDPNRIIKIPVLTSEMPRVIGMEEPFEFKKRFTTVKCLSGKIVAKKINVFDLLKLLLIYKEFHYSEKFLDLLIQKKIILIDTIKMHLKKNAIKFEKDIKIKYDELISQNDDDNKKVAAAKFRGWNNGLYLDNILDTSLHLFKPKNDKIVNTEKEKIHNIVQDILHKKAEKNIKRANKTLLNLSKENYTQPFLVTERRINLSSKIKDDLKERLNNKIKNVKNVINDYSNKKYNKNWIIKSKNIDEEIDKCDIEKKIRKPSSLINKNVLVNNINSKIRKITMNKFISPYSSSKYIENLDDKDDIYFCLKINKNKNKKISNNNTLNFSKTIYSKSLMKNDNNKNIIKNKNISNLSNKLDTFFNKKSSFSKDNKDKHTLPSIILNYKDKSNININIKEGMKNILNIKNSNVK